LTHADHEIKMHTSRPTVWHRM